MSKPLSMLLLVLLMCLAGAFGVHGAFAEEDDGLPPPTPTVHIAVPDISGKWTTEDGAEFEIAQQDQAIKLRSASGRVYEGRRGRHLVKLSHVYSSPLDVPARVPPEFRSLLVGIELRFEGEVQMDGKSINAQVIDYDIQP